jgi:hypothetical protein
MKAWITALMVGLLFVLPANAKDYGSLTNQLKRGDNEQKVIKLFGMPSSTALLKCHKQDGKEYNCKLLRYDSSTIGQAVAITLESHDCSIPPTVESTCNPSTDGLITSCETPTHNTNPDWPSVLNFFCVTDRSGNGPFWLVYQWGTF